MHSDRRRSRRLTSSGLLAVMLALALPAASGAALITVGALGKAARISDPHPVDTAYWLPAKAAGRSGAMPASGLVRVIRLRGCARPGPNGQAPLTQIHFQTLVPGPGDSVTVKVTSGPLNVPA